MVEYKQKLSVLEQYQYNLNFLEHLSDFNYIICLLCTDRPWQTLLYDTHFCSTTAYSTLVLSSTIFIEQHTYSCCSIFFCFVTNCGILSPDDHYLWFTFLAFFLSFSVFLLIYSPSCVDYNFHFYAVIYCFFIHNRCFYLATEWAFSQSCLLPSLLFQSAI